MKTFSILFFFFFLGHITIAQSSCPSAKSVFEKETTIVHQGGNVKSIYVKGKRAELILEALFNGSKRGYTNKIKHLKIPGIEPEVDLTVRYGVHGYSETGTYFHTFKNKKEAQNKIANIAKNEQLGIVIRFKKRGDDSRQTIEDTDCINEYLECLICN